MTLNILNVQFVVLVVMDLTIAIEMNIDADYIAEVKDIELDFVVHLLNLKIVFVQDHPFQDRKISTFSP